MKIKIWALIVLSQCGEPLPLAIIINPIMDIFHVLNTNFKESKWRLVKKLPNWSNIFNGYLK